MDNVNSVLANNILKYRKRRGLTQEDLAEKLRVTFQAVSKWENAKSAPDITFLPIMAQMFGCSIDELFSYQAPQDNFEPLDYTFPWGDDGIIRGVIFEGTKMLDSVELIEKFTLEIIGEAKNVECGCNLAVQGNVSGGCDAGGDVAIFGDVFGACDAGESIIVSGGVTGCCDAGDSITVAGNLTGACDAGNEITSGGSITGGAFSAENITASEYVKAERIAGTVICKNIECEKIEGDIIIDEQL